MNYILSLIKHFLPYPLVSCPECGHRGTPVALKCEKCGADLSDYYI
ncbi:MAG: hypothetical protein IJH34_10970 [Romboutsia sp.]|nr:hypothetical protein [Romboutsia sp.]